VLRQLGKNLGLREYIMQQTRAQSNFFYWIIIMSPPPSNKRNKG
jgi:hypothetical protein